MTGKSTMRMTGKSTMVAAIARSKARPNNQVPLSAFQPRRMSAAKPGQAQWEAHKNQWDNYDDHNDFPDSKPR